MNTTNQRTAIVSYLKQYGSITPMQAFDELNCTKLATRIGELRKEGVEIVDKWVNTVERKHVCKQYYLLETTLHTQRTGAR